MLHIKDAAPKRLSSMFRAPDRTAQRGDSPERVMNNINIIGQKMQFFPKLNNCWVSIPIYVSHSSLDTEPALALAAAAPNPNVADPTDDDNDDDNVDVNADAAADENANDTG